MARQAPVEGRQELLELAHRARVAPGLGDEGGVFGGRGFLQHVAPVHRVGDGQRVTGFHGRELRAVLRGREVGPEEHVHRRMHDGEVLRLVPVVQEMDVLELAEVGRAGPRVFDEVETRMRLVHDELRVGRERGDEHGRVEREAPRRDGDAGGDPARHDPGQREPGLGGDVAGVAFVEAADGVDDHVVHPVVHLVAAHGLRAPGQPAHVLEEAVVGVAEGLDEQHAAQGHHEQARGGGQVLRPGLGPGQRDEGEQPRGGPDLEQAAAQGVVGPAQQRGPQFGVERVVHAPIVGKK